MSITLTITTCKRFDLFEKTIDSFLKHCKDKHLIDRWLCIDDNSSEKDRIQMKKRFPFFEFYFKNLYEKGHSKSMNLILDLVHSPYIFHLEDDWEFLETRNYISECLDVLCSYDNIGQCLINKNYSELQTDNIIGGEKKTTSLGTEFLLHEYYIQNKETLLFYAKYGQGLNCAYWKHFSFRPSLIKREVLVNIGRFNEKAPHFEAEYSERYLKHGYMSAFLNGIYCKHIGRLTSERDDKSKANAYVLNNEEQFIEQKTNNNIIDNSLNFEIFVINLDRRRDRFEQFKQNSSYLTLNYKRVSAIDGYRLESTPRLCRIFKHNDYNMRRGIVGCALSHIDLFIKLTNSEKDAFCIFEDDVIIPENFTSNFFDTYKKLPQDWDICMLGYILNPKYHEEKIGLLKKNSEQALNFSIGGTQAYLISKNGANKLLDFIETHTMTNAIDTMIQKAGDVLNLYYIVPGIVKFNHLDTNIQNNMQCLQIVSDECKTVLKEQQKFSLDNTIKYKNQDKISIGETFFIAEGLNDGYNPFDLVSGLNIMTVNRLIRGVFSCDMNKTVWDMCCNPNISFPYEKFTCQELYLLYLKKFNRFKERVCLDEPLVLIYASKWKQYNETLFTELEKYLKTFNPNITIVNIKTQYPEHLQSDIQTLEKNIYDHSIYRFEIINSLIN